MENTNVTRTHTCCTYERDGRTHRQDRSEERTQTGKEPWYMVIGLQQAAPSLTHKHACTHTPSKSITHTGRAHGLLREGVARVRLPPPRRRLRQSVRHTLSRGQCRVRAPQTSAGSTARAPTSLGCRPPRRGARDSRSPPVRHRDRRAGQRAAAAADEGGRGVMQSRGRRAPGMEAGRGAAESAGWSRLPSAIRRDRLLGE
ncbi:hypothetical protein NDU88_005127 [Pleurodeles waltl]|uniref:Uncharacterized protein n=1 Tax=Pleurodeles waltl TaxID=8319 RepID=A0AAV7L0B2_PLEWA|nr:hypothetical protein NDU88_005127 [Pleurodeles waltl]